MTAITRAVVVGAGGQVGSGIMAALAEAESPVTGIARRARPPGEAEGIVAIDLLDERATRAAFAGDLTRTTHVFYCARAPFRDGEPESVEANVAMLRNVVEAASDACADLAHIHIVHGGKWYGFASGHCPLPAQEDQPRPAQANFYHAQQDWLSGFRLGKRWSWSASRPSYVCAVRKGHGRNIISTIGAYAALCREEGDDLPFPGTDAGFHARTEVTDRALLARAAIFLATRPSGPDAAYNVTNGDTFTWADIWPEIAARFRLKAGSPRPRRLAGWMRAREGDWARIVAREGLVAQPLAAIAHFGFADFLFGLEYDVVSDIGKLAREGFAESMDSPAMIGSMIDRYRALKLLP